LTCIQCCIKIKTAAYAAVYFVISEEDPYWELIHTHAGKGGLA